MELASVFFLNILLISIFILSVGARNNRLEEIFFLVYKSESNGSPIKLKYNEVLARNSLNKECFVVFFDHGWLGNANGEMAEIIKNAYVAMDGKDNACYNIFVLDYRAYSVREYDSLAQLTPSIAKVQSDFITKHIKKHVFELRKLVMIGHSMGGHIASFTCENIRRKFHQKCPVVHGLDLPENGFPVHKRFKANVAYCTTAIYTSPISYKSEIALKNYVFNGEDNLQTFYCKDKDQNKPAGTCAHSVAPRIYAESVLNPQMFPVYACGTFRNTSDGVNCSLAKGYMGKLGCHARDGSYYVKVPDNFYLP